MVHLLTDKGPVRNQCIHEWPHIGRQARSLRPNEEAERSNDAESKPGRGTTALKVVDDHEARIKIEGQGNGFPFTWIQVSQEFTRHRDWMSVYPCRETPDRRYDLPFDGRRHDDSLKLGLQQIESINLRERNQGTGIGYGRASTHNASIALRSISKSSADISKNGTPSAPDQRINAS